ncbi:MAG: hypothetical protein ACI9GW_001807 [Halieaceae bacterium]|jgi:hypothetical protein
MVVVECIGHERRNFARLPARNSSQSILAEFLTGEKNGLE